MPSGALGRPDRLEHGGRDAVVALGEHGGALDVDGVEVARLPPVPRPGPDGTRIALGVDARPQIALQVAHLLRAAHGAVTGHEKGIDMPIVDAVDSLITGRANVDEVLGALLSRPAKSEAI